MPKEKIVCSPRITRARGQLKPELRSVLPISRLSKRKASSPQVVRKKRITERNLNIDRQENNTQAMGQAGEDVNMDEEWRRIREERQRLIEERLEVDRLRTNIQNERQQIQHDEQRTPNENGQVVNGIVSHLQNLHLNIEVPKFNEERNPLEYLENLERYMSLKNVREEYKMTVLENILEGRVKTWYQVTKNAITNFGVFKAHFRKEFYAIPNRVQFKNLWFSRKYKVNDGSMQSYFYKQIREAQYFEPPLSAYEINYTIVQQLPLRVKTNLAAINFAETNAVSRALAQLDMSQEEFSHQKEFKNNQKTITHGINQVYCTSSRQIEIENEKRKYNTNPHRGNDRMMKNYRNHGQQQQTQLNQNRYNENNFGNYNYAYNPMPDFRVPPPSWQQGQFATDISNQNRTQRRYEENENQDNLNR